ncbi:MAG: hypothetical protein M3N98_07345 [Actinomycetota bacterium]|nr:hypothetical protein [Actinomycetota bacterium]
MSFKRWACTLASGTMLVGAALTMTPTPASAAVRGHRPIILTADGATGHLVSLSADLRAKATTTGFKPIRGLIIKFQDAGGLGNTVCTAVTDILGEATCQATASNDPLLIASGVFTGYNAVFEGNGRYLPATAHGRISPTVP